MKLAAELANEHGLPLLVSGGISQTPMHDNEPTEADLMAEQALRRWPGLNVIKESRSRTTWENACYSSELLGERGMDEVMLVSDRAHLPRALLCFQSQGVLAQAAWSNGCRSRSGCRRRGRYPWCRRSGTSGWRWSGITFAICEGWTSHVSRLTSHVPRLTRCECFPRVFPPLDIG